MLITEDYRKLNAEKHETSKTYGTSGHRWAQTIKEMTEVFRARTILDYGCGKGSLNTKLMENADIEHPPYVVLEYDPAIPEKATLPGRCDLVVCTDVLEHIEPECLDEVLDHLRALTGKAAFLTVATGPAMKTLPDGRNAHLIQEGPKWWLPKIMDRWRLLAFTDADDCFVAIGTP